MKFEELKKTISRSRLTSVECGLLKELLRMKLIKTKRIERDIKRVKQFEEIMNLKEGTQVLYIDHSFKKLAGEIGTFIRAKRKYVEIKFGKDIWNVTPGNLSIDISKENQEKIKGRGRLQQTVGKIFHI